MLGRVNVESIVDFSRRVVDELHKLKYVYRVNHTLLHGKQQEFEAWRDKHVGNGRSVSKAIADEFLDRIDNLRNVMAQEYAKTPDAREERERAEIDRFLAEIEAFVNSNRSSDL